MSPDSERDDELRTLRAQLSAAEARGTQLERWLDVTFEASPTAMGIISAQSLR